MWKKLTHYRKQYLSIGYRDRTMLMSVGSFAINALIGAGKLLMGIIFLSPWFVATAVYYLLLCAARGQLLWRFRHTRLIENPLERFDRQFAVFQRSGIFISMIGVSYFLVCMRMYVSGEGSTYPYFILYGVVAVAFYKVGVSIYGVVVSRRIKNPLLTTMKVVALMDACVSIVSVQYALLVMKEAATTAARSSAMFGAGCSIVFMGIGVFMWVRKKIYPDLNEFDLVDQAGRIKVCKGGVTSEKERE